MWTSVLILSLVFWIFSNYYVASRIRMITVLSRLGKRKSWILAFTILVLIQAFMTVTLNFVASAVSFIHLCFSFAFFNLAEKLISKKIKGKSVHDILCLCAVLVTIVYLAYGWIQAHNIRETRYTVESEKIRKPVRILQISDTHLRTKYDTERYTKELEKMKKAGADLVVITGDYVDDESKRTSMEKCTKATAQLNPPLGIYFCYGNHDKGYNNNRDFTDKDLRECLEENGIKILEDDMILLNDEIILAARKDKHISRERISSDKLMEKCNESKAVILLDHEPNDFESEAQSGFDLILSGHTHGGQMIPLGILVKILGENDEIYGMHKIGKSTFIINSGFSSWSIPYKTGTFSEYVIVDFIPSGK